MLKSITNPTSIDAHCSYKCSKYTPNMEIIQLQQALTDFYESVKCKYKHKFG